MINNEDFAKVVQKRSEYYISHFENMIKYNKKTSPNISGLLFTFVWFAYRKMYIESFIIILIKVLAASLGVLGLIISITTFFVCGYYGNYIYLKHCERKINKNIDLDEDLKNHNLQKTGGVSVIGVCATFIATFIIIRYI